MFVMLTILALASLVTSCFATLVAFATGEPKPYWFAAVSLYIFSMLAGFSFGQLTIGFALILFVLAIGSSLNLMKNADQFITWLATGVAFGFLMIFYVDDAWLFFPMTLFS